MVCLLNFCGLCVDGLVFFFFIGFMLFMFWIRYFVIECGVYFIGLIVMFCRDELLWFWFFKCFFFYSLILGVV